MLDCSGATCQRLLQAATSTVHCVFHRHASQIAKKTPASLQGTHNEKKDEAQLDMHPEKGCIIDKNWIVKAVAVPGKVPGLWPSIATHQGIQASSTHPTGPLHLPPQCTGCWAAPEARCNAQPVWQKVSPCTILEPRLGGAPRVKAMMRPVER